MGFFRGIDGSNSDRAAAGHEEVRRPVRRGVVAEGTLACERCDAPVSPGQQPLAITDRLSCPYCNHSGVVRDFLSLELPTRPARVQISIVVQRRG